MHVGLLFDLRNPIQWRRPWAEHYNRALEICEEADRLGVGGLWFTEHHRFDDGYLPQPLTFAAAVAAKTTQARIGTAIMLAALRPPAQLAEEAAIVDIVSNGRLVLGIGAGYRASEYEFFGLDIANRFALTESRIREIRRLWEEGGVSPPPVQERVPIYGGFFGQRGAHMAGRLGLGLLDISRHTYVSYTEGLSEAGLDASRATVSGVMLDIVLADEPEAAWGRIAPHAAYMQNSYRQYAADGDDRPQLPVIRPADLKRPGLDGPQLQVLSPEDAAARIVRRTGGMPVEHVILWASIAGMPDDLVERHVELVCRELAPRLASRDKLATPATRLVSNTASAASEA